MTNILKKIEAGNPLANFGLWDDLAEYEACQTDEQLADFYHNLLNKYWSRKLLVRFIYAMIGHSAGTPIANRTFEV